MQRKYLSISSVVCFCLTFICAACCQAQPSPERPFLHPLFSDNTVLQRDRVVPIWGWAQPNESVTVSFHGKTAVARAAADGKWVAQLGPFPAGGPFELTVSGPRTVVLRNVMMGDVWLCSGQSNMTFQVQNAKDSASDIAASDNPNLRLFDVPTRTAGEVREVFQGLAQWQLAGPRTVPNFSAVAYFFGRNLQQKLKVPIGLIHTSAGATTIEAWGSAEALKTTPDGDSRIAEFNEWKDLVKEWDKYDAEPAVFDRLMAEWYAANDPGSAGGAAWAAPELDDAGWKIMDLPGPWYDRGLPGYEGVVWFRRDFELPVAMQGKDLVLRLGNIDRRDTAWINGVQVGQSTSNGWRREYRVPAKLLKAGRNLVAVRILGSSGFRGESNDLRITEGGDNPTAAPLPLAGPWRYKESVALSKATRPPSLRSGNPSIPTALFNGSIAPLVPFGIKGAIWYQGESNAGNASQYARLLPSLIADWRTRFENPGFPFLIVQLANFGTTHDRPSESQWAQFREVQARVARTVPNAGLATTIDIGDPQNVHPTNKAEVGRRLALVAESVAYGQTLEYSGPVYKSLKTDGDKIRLSFDHAAGLQARGGGKLVGFAIAGADKKWAWADAVIEGDTVVLSAAGIAKPVAARYAWDDSPLGNLTNGANLPAVPFRTGDPA